MKTRVTTNCVEKTASAPTPPWVPPPHPDSPGPCVLLCSGSHPHEHGGHFFQSPLPLALLPFGAEGAHPEAGSTFSSPRPVSHKDQDLPISAQCCLVGPLHTLWAWAPPSSPMALGHRSEGSRVGTRAAPGCPSRGADLHGPPPAPCMGSVFLPRTRLPLGPLALWPGHRPAPSLPARP